MSCPPFRPCVPRSSTDARESTAISRFPERPPAGHHERHDWPTGSVLGGVDTHKHVYVAAVCDPLGRVLASASFPTTTAGFKALHAYLSRHGQLAAVEIEGIGAWGGGLSQYKWCSLGSETDR